MKLNYLLMIIAWTGICTAEGLVKNGDFEKKIAPWSCAQRGAGKHDLHELSNETKYGKACLRVTGDPKNKYNSFIALVQSLPKLNKETEYQFRVKVRSAVADATGKEFKVAIRQANDQNIGLGYTGFTLNLTESTWHTHEMRFKPDKRAEFYVMYILGSNLTRDDVVYVDDLSLTPLIETATPFNPSHKVDRPGKLLEKDAVSAKIDDQTGLLSSLSINGEIIHPEAENSVAVFVRQGNRENLLDGKNTVLGDSLFRAKAEYGFGDSFFREVITVEALADIETSIKIGVRHGFKQEQWKKIVNALRPVRVIDSGKSTIFSYGENPRDLNLGNLDQYQHTAYPMAILENDKYYLLAGSRNLDDFVTLSPNMPSGYFPSLQQNPKTVRKGDVFRFETNWKLFPKSKNRLRDLWRYYCDHLQTGNRELQQYIPPRYTEERTFYPGAFGSHTYFMTSREDRLKPGSNVWFYSWHDNISERYPIAGEWWSTGNNWIKKLSAPEVKKYIAYLQNEKNFNVILYLRQLANLNQRGKEFPARWYKQTPGGALHLYGGGYKVNLPEQVASEVGYDKIPLGQYDFSNKEYRGFYHDEIFKAIHYYRPRAIGWDMGSDLDEFLTIARTYDNIQKEKLPVKVVANESAGPTQLYSDMVLLENGLLGGKSAYDFEIVKAYTTSVVCLERFNLFALAVDANLDGKRTWLSAHGLAENKRYLDNLIYRQPELTKNRSKLAQLCQLRGSLYDLGMGASPGYLEEAQPVPESLMRMAADVNGLFNVNRSFVLRFPNGLEADGHLATSAWQSDASFRLTVFNDASTTAVVKLRLDRKYFESKGWSVEKINAGNAFEVTPEGEITADIKFIRENDDFIFETELAGFAAILVFADK